MFGEGCSCAEPDYERLSRTLLRLAKDMQRERDSKHDD
jgi:hypothetical protein